MMFGYSDRELASKSGYDLVHPDDLTYFSNAHQECKYMYFISRNILKMENEMHISKLYLQACCCITNT